MIRIRHFFPMISTTDSPNVFHMEAAPSPSSPPSFLFAVLRRFVGGAALLHPCIRPERSGASANETRVRRDGYLPQPQILVMPRCRWDTSIMKPHALDELSIRREARRLGLKLIRTGQLYRIAGHSTVGTLDDVARFLREASEPVFTFGKHKGKTVDAVHADDVAYLDWLAAQEFFPVQHPDLARAVARLKAKAMSGRFGAPGGEEQSIKNLTAAIHARAESLRASTGITILEFPIARTRRTPPGGSAA